MQGFVAILFSFVVITSCWGADLPVRKFPAQPLTSAALAYPVCLYDTESTAAEAAKRDFPKLERRLAAAIKTIGRAIRVTFVTSREVVVIASPYHHRLIRGVWPRVACYGQSSGSGSSAMLSICENYIKRSVEERARGGFSTPTADDPPCQTFVLGYEK